MMARRIAVAALILGGFLAFGLMAAEVIPEAAVPAKTILPTRKYNNAVTKAQEDYEQAMKRARFQYQRDLETAKVEYMKAQDLEGANATQALADAVAAEDTVAGRSWLRLTDGRIGSVQFEADGKVGGGRRYGGRWSTWTQGDGTLVIDDSITLRRHYVPMYVGVDDKGEAVYLVGQVQTPVK